MMVMTDIHVRSFTGAALKAYLHGIAKLRTEVFQEYPYFEEVDLKLETEHLRKIFACKETIGVLIFDNTTLVGVALGYPLTLEYSEVQKPFIDRHLNPETYFFFGDSVLLKNYRGRGIGHHFFDAREAHVSYNKKYKHICFYFPDDYLKKDLKPEGHIPLFDFWRKRGYIHHPEIHCCLQFKQIGKAHPTENQMGFWIKDLLRSESY